MTEPTKTEFQVNRTFDLPVPDTVRVPGFDRPGPLTPPGRPDYRFRPALLSDLLPGTRGSPGASTTTGCG